MPRAGETGLAGVLIQLKCRRYVWESGWRSTCTVKDESEALPSDVGNATCTGRGREVGRRGSVDRGRRVGEDEEGCEIRMGVVAVDAGRDAGTLGGCKAVGRHMDSLG